MKNVVIPQWLERLPLAPEFYPTDTEFADPIAYISKIEKEASAFGICKVIPPLPKPSRKYVLHNLNKSLSKCPELDLDVNLDTESKADSVVRNNYDRAVNDGESRAVFTTRHQELGCEKGKKVKGAVGDQVSGAQKQVWQSGEVYTLDQFEAKAKSFAKSQLGIVKEVNPLVIETMFWKAASEKPIYVEYANDVPGSGFSEPEGLLRYFDKRRRKRRKRNSFDRNNVGNSGTKNDQVDSVNSNTDNKDAGSQISPNSCTETTLNSLPSHQLHHHGSFSGQKDLQDSREMEGTAGWKLSNSPWNLQVIARSAGSLTRFMPDDIPGVTSPMVYIGMLFSWFAWHVEDHELHSLNFLHMGSPKTWYSVPGDYAFNFEETIRRHAYGGNADRLVALSLLGEKTTVLSPEIFVASGIPCCRLVQYPGEFVVTFPRAYHIGFSHGFNCGEAANFGTSKWLTIAKEAAVRRAAMNYLPMLSHQQLLYLLTMSFISRIPRSLLPGVRSSRLRYRQKEERELSVKRAFIEDILHENGRLTVLLQRNTSYHAVLWDVDSLPSSSKELELRKDGDASVLTSVGENSTENDDDNVHDVDQLSKYISAVGFDLDDDDLAYDFQIESGTLPCVACGILGFPFMAIVQPAEAASVNITALNNMVEQSTEDATDKAKVNGRDLLHVDEASLGVKRNQSSNSSMEQCPISDHSASLNEETISSNIKLVTGWNISTESLKPRIFCLEHAIEIEELLSSRGGAKVLVICHSDFQKIKTHAAVTAEEIAVPFFYTEIQLGNASSEELNLIEIAIDREDHAASTEDWTSLLNINLQHCVKVKRNSPSSKVQHLMSLGGLFSDATPVSDTSRVKWVARKFRSKRLPKRLQQGKSSDGNEIVKDDRMAKKDVKLIQYSRKRYKAYSSSGKGTPIETNNLIVRGILDTNLENPGKDIENSGKSFSGPSALPFDGNSVQCEHVENSFESHCVNSVIDTTLIENVKAQSRICPQKDKVGGSSDLQADEDNLADGNREQSESLCSENVDLTSDANGTDCVGEDETLIEEETVNGADVSRKACNQLEENDCVIKESSRNGYSSKCSDDDSPPSTRDDQMEALSNQSDSEESKSLSSEGEQHVRTYGDDDEEGVISRCTPLIEDHKLDETDVAPRAHDNDKTVFSQENKVSDDSDATEQSKSIAKTGNKRKREASLQLDDQLHSGGFIRGPCEGLRPRARQLSSGSITENKTPVEDKQTVKKTRNASDKLVSHKNKKENQKGRYKCELEGCTMSFRTKAELQLHEGNRCPVEGCRKKFNSHKYAIQHQRVHDDDRPLKCPWDGCTMSFKWAWARTEHLRVHTGERPYICKVKGCGITFRFVSDFSRHRRKTGHYVSPPA